MKQKTTLTSIMLATLLFTTGCSTSSFSNWKSDGVINQIKSFIDDVCDKNSKNYIPVEDRISCWDIDGTGVVERNLNNNDLLPQDQIFEYVYSKYRSSDADIKEAHDSFVSIRDEYWKDENETATKILYRTAQTVYYNSLVGGLTAYQATDYFAEAMENGYYTPKQKLTDITYKPMKEVYSYLKKNNFQVYFLSGTFRYALYALASKTFGDIDFEHCIGTDFDTEYKINDKSGKPEIVFTTMGDVNINTTKVSKIGTEIGKVPVISFGNSTGDLEMLQYTISGCKYKSLGVCINHDDDVREYKYSYEKVHQMCTTIGALEVSMKNEFLTIY